MTFETNKDVLEWYEKQDRDADAGVYLTPMPWNEVKDASARRAAGTGAALHA